MRDVENILVPPADDHSHRIVHGDLVECVRGVMFVELCSMFPLDGRQERAAMKRPGLLVACCDAAAFVIGGTNRRRVIRLDAAVIENGRRDVGPGDLRVGGDARSSLIGPPHDQRQIHAGLIQARFCAGERWTVVAEEQNQRVVRMPRFLKGIEQQTHSLIESRDRLIVLCQFLANFRIVGQPGRNDHFTGCIADFCYAGIEAGLVVVIGETSRTAATVRVAAAEVKKEGLLVVFADPLAVVQ